MKWNVLKEFLLNGLGLRKKLLEQTKFKQTLLQWASEMVAGLKR